MEFVAISHRFFKIDFESKLKLVFDIYDFNSDGFISEKDIRGILSHVPLEVIVYFMLVIDIMQFIF